MKYALTLAAGLILAACASPGLSYQARLPAGDPQAASYRDVLVDEFRGPEGGWFSARFERMLAGASLNGEPWFTVRHALAGPQDYQGVYSGWIDVEDVDTRDWTRTRRKCVEWDGLFDCERRAEVEQYCEEVQIRVAVTPRLVDARNGQLVFNQTYRDTASETECWDIGIVGEGKGRGWHGHGYRRHWGGGYGGEIAHLVREALSDTLPDIRRDIAPYTARVKAPLIAEAIAPEAGADLRFRQGVEAAEAGDLATSCTLWQALLIDYPRAPGVRHNAGACAEASGQYERAQLLYGEAIAAMAFYPQSDDGLDRIRSALARISGRRASETLLEEMSGEAGRLPVPDAAADKSKS